MREKIIRFIVIALVAFFSASMACADTIEKAKYPYVERIDVGYKIKPFESSDTIQYYSKKIMTEEEKENAELDKKIKYGIGHGAAITFFFYVVCGATVAFILLVIAIILLLIAMLQRNVAKKR